MADERIETAVGKINPIPDAAYEGSEFDELEHEEAETAKKKKGKDKKDKKEKKRKKKDEPVVIVAAKKKREPYVPSLVMEGIKTLKVSFLSQKIVGCVVGEVVTSEVPWVQINKETILENLDLHSESSDFLPIKTDLENYKDPTVLLGYDPDFEPDKEEDEDFNYFHVAVTPEAATAVLTKLQDERRQHEERLKNSVNKTVLPWVTLGSELEVDDSIATNTRPLIEMELETDIDDLLLPTRFTDRNVNDAKDGCVRIGPSRAEFTGIRKMRVDAGVQAIPPTLEGFAQTDPGLPVNAWSQYVYDLETAQQAAGDASMELPPDFAFQETDYLTKALEFNETFDLYVNDYPLLVLKEEDAKIPSKSMFEEYEAFTNIQFCEGLMASACTWHPMWSGTVAVAYSRSIRCVPAEEKDSTVDEVQRDVFAKSPILIWSFMDFLQPKLILECPREVQCLQWSPTYPNILVAGAVSGQIIIYDLTGRLEAVEGHEYLTPDQKQYRLAMNSLVEWMEPQAATRFVRPAALSALQYSHGNRVNTVHWLAPYFEITDTGLFKKPDAEGGTPMQVVSCGEDSCLMFWNLAKEPTDLTASGRPKKAKLRKRPSTLTADVSKFKIYDRNFRPCFVLYLDPMEKNALFTGLAFKTDKTDYALEFEYEVKPEPEAPTPPAAQSQASVNEEVDGEQEGEEKEAREASIQEEMEEEATTKESVEGERSQVEEEKAAEKTFVVEEVEEVVEPVDSLDVVRRESLTYRETYQPVFRSVDEEPHKVLLVTTEEGEVLNLKWEGFDVHKGEEITTENATILSVGSCVHDGPIVTCKRSPFIKDLVMTIGGKVVALWHEGVSCKPFFWKFCDVNYTSGTWSPYRPAVMHLGRMDGSLEVWDFLVRSSSPVLVQSLSGQLLSFMSTHTLPLHGNKSILGVGDYNNSFRMLFYPPEFQEPKPNELQQMKSFIDREVFIRSQYIKWNENYLQVNFEELARQAAQAVEEEQIRVEAAKAAEEEAAARTRLEEEEARKLARSRRAMSSLNEKYLDRLRQDQELQMQRVLLEKKRIDKSQLMVKQQPILAMKKMEKDKKHKQQQKIKEQQEILDKTVAMLFPEVIEKPPEGPSRVDLFEREIRSVLPEVQQDYEELVPERLDFIANNPFNKRLEWEKVFEEGRKRRSVLDFPLHLRQKRNERYLARKKHRLLHAPPAPMFTYTPDLTRRGMKKHVMFDDEQEGEEESEQSEGEEDEYEASQRESIQS